MRMLPALLSLLASLPAAAADRVQHDLTVTLAPASHELRVEDTLRFPDAPSGRDVEFLLHAALVIERAEPPVASLPLGDAAGFFGINGMSESLRDQVKLARYRVRLPAREATLRVVYAGRFDFGLAAQKEEYTRGFRETAGIVGAEGVYLAGSGFWVPHLGTDLVEFKLQARVPAGWHLVSQGDGSSRDASGTARWDSAGPVDEIVLCGGPLERFEDRAGAVQALVYLHERDAALAGKYLEATAQYIAMYARLLGPYPYGKFALVENFWETGYGMPSFTLLGPKVIRFPFILTSSYPHEILHNWWGNSVFVDYAGGNWCEGLTAYLADHLIQEQRGKGAEYRRAALQKYRDYVGRERDFALVEFRSRESAVTEAVGYGKTLMLFHMLRRELGDAAFTQFLQRLYREQRGRRASFADLAALAAKVAGRDLGAFFTQWTSRPGAPALRVRAEVVEVGPEFEVRGTLEQVQEGPPFALGVPVVVQGGGGNRAETVTLGAASAAFRWRMSARPLALHVDPGFDVFRRLDPRESPVSIGQIFGEPRILALLPAAAPEAEQELYRRLALGWNSDGHAIEVKRDGEVAELPADRAVWLLGRGNRHAARIFAAEAQARSGQSYAFTARHPGDASRAVGWIAIDPPAAAEGLGRKLPHYGKYSFVAFEGAEPANVLKGERMDPGSPMTVDLRQAAQRSAPLPALRLETGRALAELPPAFSAEKLHSHVRFLAAPEREGRGPGSSGLIQARDYIVEQMKSAGLEVSRVRFEAGENVFGVLRGTNPEWNEQSVIVSAHYDHLGSEGGQLHPGADDNASGVAVLLELGRALAAGERPKRSIVFAAFDAEEGGRLGSKRHAADPGAFPLEQLMGVVNLDTVGRLGAGKLQVLGTGTATEWPHIFRGAGFVTGVEILDIPAPLDSSDQASFVERGVPAVQVFTGAHADYHRPADTWDRVDVPGLVKVAAVVKEAVAYLADRALPLTRAIGGPAAAGAASGAAARRVSFGTVPDFAWQGKGVRVDGVTPGSPAEGAGVKAGDLLLALDGTPVPSLAGFSAALKAMSPGQTVRATLEREGRTIEVLVTVTAR